MIHTGVSCTWLGPETVVHCPDSSPIRPSCLAAFAYIHQRISGIQPWDLLYLRCSYQNWRKSMPALFHRINAVYALAWPKICVYRWPVYAPKRRIAFLRGSISLSPRGCSIWAGEKAILSTSDAGSVETSWRVRVTQTRMWVSSSDQDARSFPSGEYGGGESQGICTWSWKQTGSNWAVS